MLILKCFGMPENLMHRVTGHSMALLKEHQDPKLQKKICPKTGYHRAFRKPGMYRPWHASNSGP
ncbi:MAG: hypothetical protein AB1796_04440 [Bacillota bacterium]